MVVVVDSYDEHFDDNDNRWEVLTHWSVPVLLLICVSHRRRHRHHHEEEKTHSLGAVFVFGNDDDDDHTYGRLGSVWYMPMKTLSPVSLEGSNRKWRTQLSLTRIGTVEMSRTYVCAVVLR